MWSLLQDQMEPELVYHHYGARGPVPDPPVHHAFANPGYERCAAERVMPPPANSVPPYERLPSGGGGGGGGGGGPLRTTPMGHRRTPSGSSSGVYYEDRSGGSSGEYSDRPPPLAPRQDTRFSRPSTMRLICVVDSCHW